MICDNIKSHKYQQCATTTFRTQLYVKEEAFGENS